MVSVAQATILEDGEADKSGWLEVWLLAPSFTSLDTYAFIAKALISACNSWIVFAVLLPSSRLSFPLQTGGATICSERKPLRTLTTVATSGGLGRISVDKSQVLVSYSTSGAVASGNGCDELGWPIQEERIGLLVQTRRSNASHYVLEHCAFT